MQCVRSPDFGLYDAVMPAFERPIPVLADPAWRLPAQGWLAVGLGYLAGTAWQLQQARLWPAWVYGLCVTLPLLLGWAQSRCRPVPVWHHLTLWGLAAVLAFGQVGLRAGLRLAQELDPALEGRDVVVRGVVEGMPQVLPQGLRFALAPEAAWLDGRPVVLPPSLWLSWYHQAVPAAQAPDAGAAAAGGKPPELWAGERWQFTLRLKRPHGNLNPHGFDYELWMWEQGYRASGYVREGAGDPPPELLERSWQHPLERLRQGVREAIWQQLLAAGPEAPARRQAGVVVALVTGDQRAIERADWTVFRATGVAHLMSISGLHITLMAWVAAALLDFVWRQGSRASGSLGRVCLWLPAPWVGQLGGLLVALGYSAFCGWGVPAQRTVGMLALLTLLRIGGRRWPWLPLWTVMAAAVVAWDPWALLQAGFWLSFVAVGILFASDPGRPDPRSLSGQMPGRLQRWWRASGAPALLREQLLMTLALAPLTLILFGQVSLVGLLANLLAIPWVTGVVTLLALLGVAYAPLWTAAAWSVQVLAWVLEWLAAWPWATVSMPAAPWWAAWAGLAGGLVLVLRLPLALRLMGLPLLLPLLLWQTPRPEPGRFEILAADVGQGNAVIVRTAEHLLVYDTGPRYSLESDAGDRVLLPLLRALGEPVDVLMLSHRDSDHTGGAAAVLADQPQARLWSSLEAQHPLLQAREHTRCQAGQSWAWDGVHFALLHPLAADYARALKPNALSCVLRISDASGTVALLAGDIEQAQEQALLERGAALKADFLLVPHHGSKTSSSEGFLRQVEPGLAFVQAGYRNRFRHPAASVQARYEALGLDFRVQASCGALQWRSAAPSEPVCEREKSRRYWQAP